METSHGACSCLKNDCREGVDIHDAWRDFIHPQSILSSWIGVRGTERGQNTLTQTITNFIFVRSHFFASYLVWFRFSGEEGDIYIKKMRVIRYTHHGKRRHARVIIGYQYVQGITKYDQNDTFLRSAMVSGSMPVM